MEAVTDSTATFLREKRRELKQKNCKIKRTELLRNKRIRLTEEESVLKPFTLKETENLALKLKKGETDVACLRSIKRAAAESEEHINIFLKINGALYSLVGSLSGFDTEKQVEAAGCVINLATGCHKSTYKLMKASGVYLITHLYGSSPYLQDQCAWALGNMIADSSQCRDHLKGQGLLPGLIGLLQSSYPYVVQSAVFALRTYTALELESTLDLVAQGLIDKLSQLLSRKDLKLTILADVTHIFFHATIRIHDIDWLLKKEDVEKLLNLLACACTDIETNIVIITPLVRCLGNLTCSENLSLLETLSCPSFCYCTHLLSSSKYHHIQKEMLWVLSNVLACRSSALHSALDIPKILESFRPLLSVLDDAVIQVLYFLSVLVHQHKEYCPNIVASGMMDDIMLLQQSSRDDIVQAVNTFFSLFSSGYKSMSQFI